MEPHLRVELRHRSGPADGLTVAGRADAVERLAELGQIADLASGRLNTEQTIGWVARIGDTEFPVLAYAIDQDASGAPALSLVLSPDSLSIGEPLAATPPRMTYGDVPGSASSTKVSAWGDASQPDPRESIPGWQPENLAEQVAGHAEARETRAQGLDRMRSLGFARLIEPLGISAVTA